MGKDKNSNGTQQPKMDKYTIPVQKSRAEALSADSDNHQADKLSEILEAIQASRSALEGQIGGVQVEVALVRQDLRNAVDRVTEVEGRVSELEDTVKELQSTVLRLSSKSSELEFRAEDAECRARRNNLRFVGFPEDIEGRRTEDFLEQWIRSWIPKDKLSPCFVLERAHRSLIRKPPPGALPRPIIAKVLNYKDRDAIL